MKAALVFTCCWALAGQALAASPVRAASAAPATSAAPAAPAPGAIAAASPSLELPFSAALPWSRLASAHPGEWAEYVTKVGGHPVGPYLRFLVIGPPADGKGSWLEVWISARPGSATQAWRLLLVDDPAVPGGVARIVGRVLGGESREHPLPPRPEAQAAGPAATWTTGTEEAVQTEAGTLRALRSELRGGGTLVAESWIAETLPVFGLARLELASGAGLELVGFGRAGKGVVDLPPVRPPD